MTLDQIAKALPIAQGLCVRSIFFIFLGSGLGRYEPQLIHEADGDLSSTGRQHMVTKCLSRSVFANGRRSSAKPPFLLEMAHNEAGSGGWVTQFLS